jgi:N-acetylglucosaminyldiphosphoundecaprenol N-acetyl-beta-D-mannosaminyltransferase
MALAIGMTDEVAVGPFRVADRTAQAVVSMIVDLALTKGEHTVVSCYALHVQGLNLRSDQAYVEAMNHADLVYADGGSVVLLARVAGARTIERAATTDIGWDVLTALTERLGVPPTVALIGGEAGLADRAADILRARGVADPVLVEHGFHTDWEPVVQRVREAAPRIILLGLGSPQEMKWAHRWAPHLGTGTLLTCGGWFGFIAGEERRAPTPLRDSSGSPACPNRPPGWHRATPEDSLRRWRSPPPRCASVTGSVSRRPDPFPRGLVRIDSGTDGPSLE